MGMTSIVRLDSATRKPELLVKAESHKFDCSEYAKPVEVEIFNSGELLERFVLPDMSGR